MGQLIGGRQGLVAALGLALLMNLVSYWFSDRIVLSMYGASELAETDAPAIHAMVGDLAEAAGIPKPRIFLVPQEAPNAFATGRNPARAVVAVTAGIVRLLPPEELRGVLAHEIGHIKNRDILIQSVAAVLASAIMFVANMLRFAAFFGGRDEEGERTNPLAAMVLAVVAPIAAVLIQMAISRSREYLADASAAAFAGTPRPLAAALGRLNAAAREIPLAGNPATENLFIVSPFSGRSLAGLFSTHPPVEARIERLLALEREVRS